MLTPNTPQDARCFRCDGSGIVVTHLTGPTLSTWANMRCVLCDGTGVVPQWQVDAHAEGTRRRALRLAARLTHEDMATRLGVTAAQYSRMEYGTVPWPAYADAVFRALEKEDENG